ncbi:hypothetical protein DFH09DRAFT_952408 [Mycena vulgaris]|nr:hypothetical protein DFH09DRAFT_963685 [Mycena vulgaris]KAJ6476071.1 hypothetical protein DFH09DRAFT_952408 [Mycena vulgaris]
MKGGSKVARRLRVLGRRSEAAEELLNRTEQKLTEAGLSEDTHRPILHAAKSLFIDEPSVSPLKITQYYLGHIPSTKSLITRSDVPDTLKHRKLSSHIAAEWHTSAIHLAGRIFGSVQRKMAARAVETKH